MLMPSGARAKFWPARAAGVHSVWKRVLPESFWMTSTLSAMNHGGVERVYADDWRS